MALQPGTLVSVREYMCDEGSDSRPISLRRVAAAEGYIYKFVSYIDDDPVFPIRTTSLATGKGVDFYPFELEPVKEQDQ